MKRMAENAICKALGSVKERMNVASQLRHPDLQHVRPRLVAVSKTKPLALIQEAYSTGQRHFGENYVAELNEKSMHPITLTEMSDIKWHFIGQLQSNKVKKVIGVPNLWMVETVSSQKLAAALNNQWEKTGQDPLNVMVQVNTSGEANKGGVPPEEASSLMKYVLERCPQLCVKGLMTIGAFDHDLSKGPNPDFQCLISCKARVCEELALDPSQVELSMGMSNDFEHAIEHGSTNVRVGSTIFGARDYTPKQGETNGPTLHSSSEGSSKASENDSKPSNSDPKCVNSQEEETSERLQALAI